MEPLLKEETKKPSAAKYYDYGRVKEEVVDEIGSYDLSEIEFEPGRYEISYDFIGEVETACRTFGLKELGIVETDTGYYMEGDSPENEVGSLPELTGAEDALFAYTEKLAEDLNEHVNLPGAFMFGFNTDIGEGFRLFYLFEEQDIPALRNLGAEIPEPKNDKVNATFDEIIAAIEDEGCYDIAERLHAILREN